jgi:hypothetical protein
LILTRCLFFFSGTRTFASQRSIAGGPPLPEDDWVSLVKSLHWLWDTTLVERQETELMNSWLGQLVQEEQKGSVLMAQQPVIRWSTAIRFGVLVGLVSVLWAFATCQSTNTWT